jgi:hypothetical protein
MWIGPLAALALLTSLPGGAAAQFVGSSGLLVCPDPGEVIVPGVPAAFFCGRSGLLDDPIDHFLPSFTRTRPGHVHGQLTPQYLRLGRANLGEMLFAELSGLPSLDTPGNLPLNHALARALLGEIARAGDPGGALQAQLDALSVAAAGVPFASTFNARFAELLPARQDRNRDLDLTSPGFLTLPTADTVDHSASGLAENFLGVDRVTGQDLSNERGVDTLPFFIGPDGLRNTADDLPLVRCPGLMEDTSVGGRCTGGASDAENEPLYYVIPGGAGSQAACDALVPADLATGTAGGLNANGECIVQSTHGFVDGAGNVLIGSGNRSLAALDKLLDPSNRPADASLEPTNLVDLRLRATGVPLLARPPSGGGIQYPESSVPFARRVDPVTGAPVRATGPLQCALREGGPDGNPATSSDNEIPSVGNCLLFDNPQGNEMQTVRAPGAIAADHPADQTLFALLGTQLFDEDAGQSLLDFTNDLTGFAVISAALGGSSLLSGLVVRGYSTVRPPPVDPDDQFDKAHLREIGLGALGRIFGDLPDPNGGITNEAIFVTTDPAQRALLGCGEGLLSACDETQADMLRNDPTFAAITGLARPELLRGGIDLENADAAVVFQDFTRVKLETAGELVGQRAASALRFEAGISGSEVMDPNEAQSLGVPAWQVARDRLAQDLFGVPYASLTDRRDQLRTATDFNVEPTKWVVDPTWLAQGVVVFQDPRGANGIWDGGTGDDVIDPLGEDCTGIFTQGLPDPGCTALEVLSANIERGLAATEVVGTGAVFDPPETVAEIQAFLDGDPNNDPTGDPFCGQDGIRFNNFDQDGNGRVEDVIGETADQKAVVVAQNNFWIAVDSFSDCLRATAVGGSVAAGTECFLDLEQTPIPPATDGNRATRQSRNRLVAALPVGLRLTYRNTDGTLVSSSSNPDQQSAAFPFQRLTRVEMQTLVNTDELTVARDQIFTAQDLVDLSTALGGATIPEMILLDGQSLLSRFFQPQGGYDLDGNASPDMDEDNDRAFDFDDDGFPGPIATGNFFCGSGIPGDVLNVAAQHELDSEQRALLQTAFPSGFPPRSPVFCASTGFLLSLSGESSPGRRDFLWHGAGDQDDDGVADGSDLCPTIADPDQADQDGDGVGDLCDNCVEIANPRASLPLAAGTTTTGGQRDDDVDGFGNVCDAKVTGSMIVGGPDVAEFVASIAKPRTRSTCGQSRMRSCAIFDLDEKALLIGGPDIARLISLLGRPAGPRCDACGDFLQLPCEGPACPAP